MKYLIEILLATALAMLGAQAHALTIAAPDPQDDCNLNRTTAQGWLGPVDCFTNPSNDSETFVRDYTGVTDLNLVYKGEAGSPVVEEGGFAGDYTTTYDVPNDPLLVNAATISWDGPGIIDCPECFLTVKDGANEIPVWYLYDIGNWNGTDAIVLTGFWPDKDGAISHVAIYSNPAPGPLVVMALGLVGMISLSSRARKAS